MTDYFSYTLDADAIRAISSIGLAHLGDAVYELLVRTYLCVHGKATGKGLHRATVELVCAPQQARPGADGRRPGRGQNPGRVIGSMYTPSCATWKWTWGPVA